MMFAAAWASSWASSRARRAVFASCRAASRWACAASSSCRTASCRSVSCSSSAQPGVLQRGLQRGQTLSAFGCGVGGQRLSGLEGADLAAGLAHAFRGRPRLFQQRVQLRLQCGDPAIQLFQPLLLPVDFRQSVLLPQLLPPQLSFQLVDGIPAVLNAGAQQLRRRLPVPRLGRQIIGFLTDSLLSGIVFLHPQGKLVVFLIEGVLPGLGGILPGLGGGILRLEAVPGGPELLQTLHPE